MIAGAKLPEMPGAAGADSEQFTAQHNLLPSAIRVASLLFALSQHFIIFPLLACIGAPERTPPANEISIRMIASRLVINSNIYAEPECVNRFRLPDPATL